MTPPPASPHTSPPTSPVVLVGHCGPDSSYLRLAVQKALPGAPIRSAHDDTALSAELAASPDALFLVNRALEPGFSADTGVELIAHYAKAHPNARLMLVSNYPEAQEAAVKAGALPGFGKRDIGSPRLTTLLQSATRPQ